MATAAAPAKVNLFLEVVGKRDDGFHDIVTVMQEIDLVDCVSATLAKDGHFSVRCRSENVPCDDSNLVIKATKRLREKTGARGGLEFMIEKHIPVGAGLGGGSSDAAAALKLANRLWGLKLSPLELAEIGAEIGSDIPFFLHGGTCLCRGRGEEIVRLREMPKLNLMLVSPNWGISTAAAYGALPGLITPQRVQPFLDAMQTGDFDAIAANSFNRFEGTVYEMEPRQRELAKILADQSPMCTRMSGSGSSMWCMLSPDQDPRDIAGKIDACKGSQILEVQTVV